ERRERGPDSGEKQEAVTGLPRCHLPRLSTAPQHGRVAGRAARPAAGQNHVGTPHGHLYERGMPQLASNSTIHLPTPRQWRQRSWGRSRRLPGAPNRWFVWADKDELIRLRRLRDAARSRKFGSDHAKDLTTPKQKPDAEDSA